MSIKMLNNSLGKVLNFIYPYVIMSFREINIMNFAKNLKLLRRQRRMSQVILADKLGVSQRTVSHYENGTSEPSLQTLCKIAEIFDISTDALLGYIRD